LGRAFEVPERSERWAPRPSRVRDGGWLHGFLVGDGDGGEAKAKEKAPDSDGQSAAVGAVGAAAKALRWERWERRRQRRRDFESLARKRLH
jgi:hypothetical protein